MKTTLPVIVPARIYDTTMEFCSEKVSRNWHARLRRHGFKRSTCGEAYYHPAHWKSAAMSFGKGDPGDTWIMNDAFKAVSDLARAELVEMDNG